MTIDNPKRPALLAGCVLASPTGWGATDGSAPAGLPSRAHGSAQVLSPDAAPPARDAAPLQVATAASAGMAAPGQPLGGGAGPLSTDPPAALLVIAAVLVVVFVSTRRQRDDR